VILWPPPLFAFSSGVLFDLSEANTWDIVGRFSPPVREVSLLFSLSSFQILCVSPPALTSQCGAVPPGRCVRMTFSLPLLLLLPFLMYRYASFRRNPLSDPPFILPAPPGLFFLLALALGRKVTQKADRSPRAVGEHLPTSPFPSRTRL